MFKNPFRDPSTNVRYTKALFLEQSYSDTSAVRYTLKDDDHNGYTSLYRVYMEMEDPLEVNFAKKYFDGYEHWLMVANATWMKPYIERWREELNLKMRARALANIKAIAQDATNKACFGANKLLLEGGWQTKEETKKVGRPSKDAIKAEAERLFQNDKDLQQDYQRLVQ